MKKIILSLAGMCLFLAMIGCGNTAPKEEEIELTEDTTEVVVEDTADTADTAEAEIVDVDTTVAE